MTDRVYPANKPKTTTTPLPTTTNTTTANRPFPTKSQLYRPAGYRPQTPRRSGRSRCCSCCLWTTLLIFLILLLAAISAAVIWVFYRPQRASFSVSSLQISQFNYTSNTLNTKFNLTIAANNPNKKLIFFYDPVTISLFDDGVSVGSGSLPGFQLGTKNTTVMTSVVTAIDESVDATSGGSLQSDLKNTKSGLNLMVELDTKISVKMGSVKTKKVKVRVRCNGIKAGLPTEKTVAVASPAPAPAAVAEVVQVVPASATLSGSKCKVDLRIKIWKWTF
ncbi:hypothetical protein Vadar_020285 [Vaccinium darrowii]|uniref:Uncharacterized protein n=1 Tax=Vaccinium darrowii TaxID=229202 RepID=A0ACB7ZLP8_9ERIC|nr:hypothetical protein Vadar_020285 [Vaccinium darrowii]